MDGETRTADDLTKRTMYNPRLKPLYMSVFCLALVSLLYNKPASSTINRSINRITTSPVHCNYLSMIMFMFPAVPVTKRKASSHALDPRPLKRSRTSDDPRAVKRARTSDATWRSVPPSQKLQSSIAVQRDGEKEPRKGERKMKYLPIDPTKRVEPYPKGKGEYFVLMQRTARLVILNEDFRFRQPGLQTIPEMDTEEDAAKNAASPMDVDVDVMDMEEDGDPMDVDMDVVDMDEDVVVLLLLDVEEHVEDDAEDDIGDGAGPSIEESGPGPVESMRPASTRPRSGGLRRSARLAHSGLGSNFTPSGRRFSMRLRSLQKET